MEELNLEYRIPRFIVNLLTTLMSAAFTAYQIYLFFEIKEQRVGRVLAIIIFLCLSFASLFSLIPVDGLRKARPVLLIVGLTMYFILKLFSVNSIFGKLDFNDIPSVLNCAIYIFVELALLILAVYCLILRPNIFFNIVRKPTVILMSVVIALFVACLVMELVLMLKYGLNIELKLRYTLLSRFFYCFGFVGMAVGFMIPSPVPKNTANRIKSGIDQGQDLTPVKFDDDFIV